MATATERVPVLMTPTEKKQFVSKAKAFGISVGELMRRATATYKPNDDDEILEAMINQMNQATENAERSIDDALLFVAKSNKRIKKMEASAR